MALGSTTPERVEGDHREAAAVEPDRSVGYQALAQDEAREAGDPGDLARAGGTGVA